MFPIGQLPIVFFLNSQSTGVVTRDNMPIVRQMKYISKATYTLIRLFVYVFLKGEIKMEKRSSVPGFIISIIMILISTVGLMLLGEANTGVPGMLVRFIVGIVAVIFMASYYGMNLKSKGFFKGIFSVIGLVGVACCIHNLIAMRTPTDIGFKEGLPGAIFMFVLMMAVGVFEEAIYRGVLFNTLRNCFGEGKGRIVLAVIISAIPFGLVHFINLTAYPNLVVWTTAQVVYATAAGFLFGSIYYITNNFWLVAFLHGLYDFFASVWACYSTQAQGIGFPTVDQTLMEGIQAALPDVTFGLIALIVLVVVLNIRENASEA